MTNLSVPYQPALPTPNLRWPWATYVSRAFLVPVGLLFIMISLRCFRDPMHTLAQSGVTLSEPEAWTDMRIVGAITLTLVFVVLGAAFSRNRLREGHLIVMVLMFLALVVRFYGFAVDGTTLAMGSQRVKTIGEFLFLILNSIGFTLQTLRAKTATVAQS